MKKNKCNRCEGENFSNARYCSSCGYELPKSTESQVVQETEPKSGKKTVSVATTMGIAVGILIAVFAVYGVQQLFSNTNPSLDQVMLKMASELNASCPIMVDSDTRLDNTIVLPKNTFQYNYTLVNMESESVDTVETKRLIEPNIINLIKTNPQMKFARDNKMTMNYLYRDKRGSYVCIISIKAEQYK